jgi:hypothetical protein
MTAMQEFVVPKSMPNTLAIKILKMCCSKEDTGAMTVPEVFGML